MIKCNYCGSENEDHATFCQNCGKQLEKEKTSKKGFFKNINWIAVTIGLIVGLFACLLTAKTLSYAAFTIVLPIVGGIVSTFLANDVKYKKGINTGFISVIIPGIILLPFIFGLVLLLMGVIGGFLGALLNKYVFNSLLSVEGGKSRTEGIQKWWKNKGKGIRVIIIFLILILGVGLFASAMSMSASTNTQKVNVTPANNTTNQLNNTNTATTPVTTNNKTVSSDSSSKSKFPMVPAEDDKVSCPQCRSFNNIILNEIFSGGKYIDSFKCNNCGYTWDEPFSTPAKGTPLNG